MRTKSLKDFKNSISEINNHQTQLKFVYEQFRVDNIVNFTSVNSNSKPNLSTEVFASNKYSQEYCIEVDKFEDKAKATKAFLFNSIFVFIYTRFEVYLRSLYFQAKYEINLEIPELKKFKIPETFFTELEIRLKEELSLTFEYLRLRRNSIVHRSDEKYLQGEVSSFVKSFGSRLNKFWRSNPQFENIKSITIKQIDFASTKIGAFQETEIIDTINLYRVISEIIDIHFISKFSRNEWVEIIKARYLGKVSKKSNIDVATKELSWIVNEFLGTTLTNEEVKYILEV